MRSEVPAFPWWRTGHERRDERAVFRHRELEELVPAKTPWFGVLALVVMLTLMLLFTAAFVVRFFVLG